MNNSETKIYMKDTNSGWYINYDSYKPWRTKVTWIRALYDRAYEKCSIINLFLKQVTHIKKIQNKKILKKVDVAMIFCRITYTETQRETLIKNLTRKLKRHLDKSFKLINI